MGRAAGPRSCPGRGRTALAGFVAVLALVTHGCARPPGASGARPTPGQTAPHAELPALEAPRVPAVRLETDVTYVASLVHWIDSLAGTSGGKTIPAYRRLWEAHVGAATQADLEALGLFHAARVSRTAHARCVDEGLVDGGPLSDWRKRFLFLALEARDVEGFVRAANAFLSEEEGRGLVRALSHFAPGFDTFWRRNEYLLRFERTYREELARGGMLPFLGEVARFFDVEPGSAPPPVLCFVLLPVNGSTHAQAVGRRLLIEIRPLDTPPDQAEVVAHEAAHFLFDLLPPDRKAALEERARLASPGGEGAWKLLDEALPTAIGQGLAVSRLAPRLFRENDSWYHIPEVDLYAKRLFPLVSRDFLTGAKLDGAFLEEAIRIYEGILPKRALIP